MLKLTRQREFFFKCGNTEKKMFAPSPPKVSRPLSSICRQRIIGILAEEVFFWQDSITAHIAAEDPARRAIIDDEAWVRDRVLLNHHYNMFWALWTLTDEEEAMRHEIVSEAELFETMFEASRVGVGIEREMVCCWEVMAMTHDVIKISKPRATRRGRTRPTSRASSTTGRSLRRKKKKARRSRTEGDAPAAARGA